MTSCSVIIPVFNRAALTARCLRALEPDPSGVVVVDDASTDATCRLLEACTGGIQVVRHNQNQGFAASCNDGAAVAAGDYLVFLNNDTIPHPGWLKALVSYADSHPGASVVSSKLVYPDNTIQHAGVVICQDLYPRHIYTGFPAEHPAVNKSRRFQIVTGACMLVRRDAFNQAGGFDLGFRNGFEDVDLCLRLGALGHEVHYCAESVVQHLESVSPGRFRRDRDNVARYRERWLERVRPDDVSYYLEDGLLNFTYEGAFPIGMNLSPRLAVLDGELRKRETEILLAEQARLITDLRRENTRLSLALSGADPQSAAAQYDEMRGRIREMVRLLTPAGATILVVSKGDRALVELEERNGWHFPQTEKGVYAGYHPADSAAAIAHLETLRAKGVDYLLFPKTAFWWLEHYSELGQYLRTHYRVVANDLETCLIFELRRTPEEAGQPAGNIAGTIRNGGTIQPWKKTKRRAMEGAAIKEGHDSK